MVDYVGVHLLDNPYFIDNAYDYFLPPSLRGRVCVGDFVTVPFGNANRRTIGLIVALKDAPDKPSLPCKPVFSLCDRELSLSEEMLGLCFFIKEQTLCTLGDAVRAVMPAAVLSALRVTYRLTRRGEACEPSTLSEELRPVLDLLQAKKAMSGDALQRRFEDETEALLSTLTEQGLIERTTSLSPSADKSLTLYASAHEKATLVEILADNVPTLRLRSEAHRAIARHLSAYDEPIPMSERELCDHCGVSAASVRSAVKKGLLRTVVQRVDRSLSEISAESAEPRAICLNDEQQAAFSTLCSLFDELTARAALLHGVTGSGKTSVMLALIDHVLSVGLQTIVLLPEIALTPQSLSIFCSRYGKRVAIVHSGLSMGERWDTYRRIREGGADVVIGTRSAVFAPLPRLGAIIIDEEQEHTYKSDMNPKYHARDVARYRCAHANALMLLCSATPSFESYTKARDGIYTLVELKSRYGGAVLPRATVVDMRRDGAGTSASPLGTLLCQRLTENLAEGNQSILFLNRRGYNNFLSCRSCGEPIRCPKCSVSMAYHTVGRGYERGELRCHWCGFRAAVPTTCPACGSEHLARMGFGTQRIEQELSELLPTARILRMDADTTTSRYAYEDILGQFRRHEADVLLGTQMVTKGHDFPDVTLVGVLLADASLYLDDYRAGERTFSMLTQVIGRAGRGKKAGEAIIQTVNPNSDCIRLACEQDYPRFYENEIRLRRSLRFPPYCDIAMLTLSSPDEAELCRAATRLYEEFVSLCEKEYADLPLDAFGPFEAPVYRVENRYRMRMVVKCRLGRRTRALFSTILNRFSGASVRGLTLSIDFNPSGL